MTSQSTGLQIIRVLVATALSLALVIFIITPLIINACEASLKFWFGQ